MWMKDGEFLFKYDIVGKEWNSVLYLGESYEFFEYCPKRSSKLVVPILRKLGTDEIIEVDTLAGMLERPI